MILNTDGLKTVASECGSGFFEGLMYSKTFWEFLTMMVHASSLQPRQNPNCSKKPCGVTYISRPCCSCIWSRLLKHCFFFKFTIPLLLFICTSLCFVSYILFKIQKWCEALVKFLEIYNFNFCIFLLMFLAYDVDVIAF